MTYKIIPLNQINGFSFKPKVAKNSFARKTGHEKGRELIDAKVSAIESNPLAFNGEKALFYLRDVMQEGEKTLKIVPEDYASVSAALEVNRDSQAAIKGQFLRPHYAAGVIILCKTTDDKIIIGSRDANRDRDDPTKYPLQFPCGFIDVDEAFYSEMQKGQDALLYQALFKDAKRELKEEVLNFNDAQILHVELLAAIYETKQWPVKEEKGGGTKDVHVIKSFVIEVNVNMTYDEISDKRNAEIKKLRDQLDADPKNKELLRQEKDFGEMKVMGCVDIKTLPELLVGKTDGTKAEIDFDGKERKFVAEHGMALDAIVRAAELPKNSPQYSCAKAVASLEKEIAGTELSM